MLYVEIYDQTLILAHIHRNKTILHKIIELPLLTIDQGIIFNPNQLLTHIKNFIQINKLKKPRTIVNVPSIQQKADPIQTLAILQHTLIISKANLRIQKLIAVPISEKNAMQSSAVNNFFLTTNNDAYPDLLLKLKDKKNAHPILWIIGITIGLICTSLALGLITNSQNQEIQTLTKAKCSLQPISTKLDSKIKELTLIKNQNVSLRQSLDLANQYLIKNQNPHRLLATISKVIPNNTWLTKIELGTPQKTAHPETKSTKSKTHPPKGHKLTLVGYSNKIESPLTFIKKLSESNANINNPKLAYLKRIYDSSAKSEIHSAEKKYEFKIEINDVVKYSPTQKYKV